MDLPWAVSPNCNPYTAAFLMMWNPHPDSCAQLFLDLLKNHSLGSLWRYSFFYKFFKFYAWYSLRFYLPVLQSSSFIVMKLSLLFKIWHCLGGGGVVLPRSYKQVAALRELMRGLTCVCHVGWDGPRPRGLHSQVCSLSNALHIGRWE